MAKHFEFTQDELRSLLYETNTFIAGSAPLYVYTQEKLFDNMDLDIFLITPAPIGLTYEFKADYFYLYENLAKEKIFNILESKGYTKFIQSKSK